MTKMQHLRQTSQNGRLLKPTLPTIHDQSAPNQPGANRSTPPKRRHQPQPMNQKTNHVAPAFRETVDARAFSIEDPRTKYTQTSSTTCNGIPTEDLLRR